MNANLKKIRELSDCESIQKRWHPQVGDWFTSPQRMQINNLCVMDTFDQSGDVIEIAEIKVDKLWLPVGFNPETGNLQIDDLLMEILGYKTRKSNMEYLEQEFRSWRQIRGEGFVLDVDQKEWETPRTRADFLAHNSLILKLTWLRELIEDTAKKEDEG